MPARAERVSLSWDYSLPPAPSASSHLSDILSVSNKYVDEFKMEPGSVVVADMRPDNAGIWLMHCHVNDHIAAGVLRLPTSHPLIAPSYAPGEWRGGGS